MSFESVDEPDDVLAERFMSVPTFDAEGEKCSRVAVFDPEDVESALKELDRQASSVSGDR